MTALLEHTGLHIDRTEHSERERAFAEAWRKENEQSSYRQLLDALLLVQTTPDDPDAQRGDDGLGITYTKRPLGHATPRDAVVAATVVQWLGSNVGFDFLQEALRAAGYRIDRCKP